MTQFTKDDFRIVGGTLTDEIYTHETCGSYNVSRILRELKSNPDWERWLCFVPIVQNLITQNAAADVNVEYSKAMPDSLVLRTPCIMVGVNSVKYITIDGSHRLRERIRRGEKNSFSLVLPYDVANHFKSSLEVRVNGVWREVDGGSMIDVTRGMFPHQQPEFQQMRNHFNA